MNNYQIVLSGNQSQQGHATFDESILAGQIAPSSMAMYKRDFEAYIDFAGDAAAILDPTTLARWRTHLAQGTDKSPNTINRMVVAIKSIMTEAAAQGYITFETALVFERVRGVKEGALKNRTKSNARVRIEPEEMRTICNLPGQATLVGLRDTALLSTLASSALRVSELITLTRSQIRQKGNGFIVTVIGKNNTEPRDAPLSREAYQHIQAWIAARPIESEYIFTSFGGRGGRFTTRPMTSAGAWNIVKGYARKAGLGDIKPHDFRRFVGTQLAKKDIRQAQKALGHKNINTTARHYVLDELTVGLTDSLY